jgi:phosphoserine phosphatase
MKIKLVAFDMEGCLTDTPTLWEIMHTRIGTWDSHGRPYWEQYRAGAFDYDTFARMDVSVWQGSPVAELHASVRDVPLMPGCDELLGSLADAGIAMAIISNGLLCLAARFRDAYGVEHLFANRVHIEDGRLTGGLDVVLPYEGKGGTLRALASRLGIPREAIASVGDSASDVGMFRESRIGVAFRPSDDVVTTGATHVVEDGDLRTLMPILLG